MRPPGRPPIGAAPRARSRTGLPATLDRPDKLSARLGRILDHSPSELYVFDAVSLRFLQVNRAARRNLGYSREELSRLTPLDLNPEFTHLIEPLRASKRWPVVFETFHRRKDGSRYPIEVQLHLSRNETPPVFVAIVQDLTARKRAEDERAQLVWAEVARAEAEAAERRAAFLAEATVRLTASLDFEATLSAVTDLAVGELADYSLVDLLEGDGSTRRVAAAHVDPAARGLIGELRGRPPGGEGWAPVLTVLRTGRSQVVAEVAADELEAWIPDAGQRELVRRLGIASYLCVPLVARGRTLGALSLVSVRPGRRYGPTEVALAEDLARRAALAADNARLYQQAQEAVRARGEFLARASHELRTPLTSALGTVRLLKRALSGELHEPPEVLLAIANRNLSALASLVDDLLDVSKLEAGRMTLALETVELAGVIGRSLEVIGAQARDKGVSVRVEVPAALRLPADPLKLEQVLVNLLANAVKFTPPGGQVTISAGAEQAGEGRRVRICVQDTGEGIAAEHLEAIFEPFFQASRPRPYPADRRAARTRGTGLGLAICRGIVELHRGRIWAESDGPGRGSTFTVLLPAEPAGRPSPS